MDWNDLRYFLAIARTGSLTVAAKSLRVSQPTVSRRLAELERQLATKLFERSKSGYRLSGAGAEIYDQANHVSEEIAEIERTLSGHDQNPVGQITLTCTEVMSNLYLTPHLARFTQANPGIALSVNCTFQNLSLHRGEADIALRHTSTPPDTLIGRRLVKIATAVYVARDRANMMRAEQPWPWIAWQNEAQTKLLITSHFPDAKIRHYADDMQTMRAMTRAGMGITVLPCYVGDTDPGLVRMLPEPTLNGALDIWVLRHPAVRQVKRLRLMTEFLADTILADRALFEGERPEQF